MLAPGLVALGVTGQIRRLSLNLPCNEPEHRCGHGFLWRPRTPWIPQEAELHGNAQPVRIGSMRCDELSVGGSERLKLFVFSNPGWQRHDLGVGLVTTDLRHGIALPVNKLSAPAMVA
jgi:hypothetical protein